MALPVFFANTEETVDSTSGLPVLKLLIANRSAFGGNAILNHILPENAGGTVSSARHVGADNSGVYSSKVDISMKMALLYNAHAQVVTPIFGQAITAIDQPFNFAGIALNSTQAVSDHWDKKTVAPGTFFPPPRDSFNLGYVDDTQRVVLFGGENNGTRLGDHWEWDGIAWIQKVITTPSARSDFAIANGIFSAVNKTILFGGFSTLLLNDTWEYNGSDWIQRFPVSSPSQRIAHAMVYDSVRQVIVLFGGFVHAAYSNETWEYDGTNWTQVITAHTPSTRSGHSMAYDPFRGKTILFGGRNNSIFYGDTWEYNGIDWTEIFVSGVLPDARDSSRMVFSATEKRALMFGGLASTLLSFDDMWQYDGISWIRINTSGPSQRYSFGLTYDPGRDKTVLFGGADSTIVGSFGDTWEFGSPLRPVNVQTSGDGYVYYDANPGRPIPVIGDFLGPSASNGAVTPIYDGYSPVFGIAVEGPVIDPNNAPSPLQIALNDNIVGIIKLRIRPFYGFIAPTAPSITGFTPSSGIVGDKITLDGTVFVGTTQLTINDAYGTTASFSVVSNNQITFIVPAGAQEGTITVMNAQGDSTSSSRFVTLPIITSVTAPVRSVGSTVTIHGHTFDYTTSITFDGTNQPSFTVDNDTQITTTIPGAASTGSIVVTITYPTADTHTATYPNFTVVAPPVISNVAPLSGPVGTSPFTTLNGGINSSTPTITVVSTSGFLSSGDVLIDNEQISYAGETITTLTGSTRGINGTSPASHSSGAIVSSLTINPNGYVSITGTGLAVSGSQLDGYGVVEFVDVATMTQILPATRTIFSDTSVSVIVPNPGVAQPSTAYYIRVTTDGGVVLSSQQFTIISPPKFLASPGPTFLSQASNSQGVAGETVRIFGDYGFTGVQSVYFNGARSPFVHFVDDGYITATIPTVSSDSDFTGPISITSIGGTKSTSDAPTTAPINFTILQQPTITSIANAANGTQTGGTGDTIIIRGTNLLAVSSVMFTTDGYASFTIVNNTTINATVPSSSSGIAFAPTQGPITVTKGAFTALSGNFLYYPPPTGLSVSPSPDTNGYNGGFGTAVTITGMNLNWGPVLIVRFGAVQATITSSSVGSVDVTVPSGAGNGISLTSSGGAASVAFTVLQPVTISSFSTDYSTPRHTVDHHTASPLQGTLVDVYGSNFLSANMTVSVISPSQGNASITVAYTFFSATHIQFSASSLSSFEGYTCVIQVVTSYPTGEQYVASTNGLNVIFVVS